jgi:O-glycosyl hydrolase
LNYMVPFIKTAMEQSYYPVRLFGTPWSPPAWMKRNGAMDGSDSPGLINDSKIYSAWALLLSKFVSAYKALGIEFWGITVQNESEFAAPWVRLTFLMPCFHTCHTNHALSIGSLRLQPRATARLYSRLLWPSFPQGPP